MSFDLNALILVCYEIQRICSNKSNQNKNASRFYVKNPCCGTPWAIDKANFTSTENVY